MIETSHPSFDVYKQNMSRVLHDANTIKAMAVQLVAVQVESHIDMMNDCDEEITFASMKTTINDSKEAVIEYIQDLVAEFKQQLIEEINNVDVRLKQVILSEKCVDANVEVSYKPLESK